MARRRDWRAGRCYPPPPSTSPDRPLPMAPPAPPPRPYRVTVLWLSALALALLAYPAVRLFWDYEIDINEGWNAYHQLRAIAGQPLYDTGSPLFFNNYPPLSFYVVGALAKLIGDPLIAGRLVSLAAIAAIAWAVARIVRSAGASALDALFGAATCILLFAAFATDYLGMNDPQLLGQALVLAGLATHLGRPATPARAVTAAVLLAAGVLTKHNLVAVPLVVAIDVLARGPVRVRVAFFAAGLGLAASSAAILWGMAGKAFFTQLLASRTWDVERAFLFTTETLSRLQAPLAAVGLALIAARRRRPAGLVLGYLGLALALGVFFSGGAGTDVNVWFDVSIALAIGAGLAAHLLDGRVPRAAFALAVNAGVLFYAPLCLGRFGVDALGEMSDRERLFHADVAYLQGIPGTVLCQSQLLCFRAGKPMFYDGFNVNQAMLAGRLPADTLIAMLRRHDIAVLQISDVPVHGDGDYPGVQTMPNRFVHFQDDVFAVLAEEYTVDRVGISGRFFRPKRIPTP